VARTASTPISITGLGAVTAAGQGVAAVESALRTGACHLRRAQREDLPLTTLLPTGIVDDTLLHTGRTRSLARIAASEALADAHLDTSQRSGCAIIVGTCTAGLPESEAAYLRDPQREWPIYAHQPSHRITADLAHHTGCGGSQSTHSVACASAACAMVEACEWIRQGFATRVLVVGVDALTRATMAGFHGLMLVDPKGTRPLTLERQGMSLGEGAAALLLEDPRAAQQRGAHVHAHLLGWGLQADGYHATAPDPSGLHLTRCIDDCLIDSGLNAGDIDYVSAHGTGTADNDVNEARVLAQRFGAVPTASCKRSFGHTLGASAAIEAIASCLALERGCRWPSAGADCGTPLSDIAVVTHCESTPLRAVLSTTLAFGGSNAALCFGPSEGFT
jgi:3-oxoacyl-[acyl-carrier-protein] synthase II